MFASCHQHSWRLQPLARPSTKHPSHLPLGVHWQLKSAERRLSFTRSTCNRLMNNFRGGGRSVAAAISSRALLLLAATVVLMAHPCQSYHVSRDSPKVSTFQKSLARSNEFKLHPFPCSLDMKRKPIAMRRFASEFRIGSKVAPALVLVASTLTGASAGASAAASAGGGAATGALTTSLDPLLEAEVLTDLAHISLDLFTVLGPARLMTRLAAIVGRVLAMLADYVPDHKVLPEELVFQAIMMVVAFAGLFQALVPVALASLVPSNTMMRDGKVFATVFEPAGMTWSQFKAMRAYCADWVQVASGQAICSDGIATDKDSDCIYWLHRGEVEILSADESKLLCRVRAGPRVASNCTIGTSRGGVATKSTSSGERFLGATHLLTASTMAELSNTLPTVTKAAGSEVNGSDGATLLRIRARKLKVLLESDPEMAEAMRRVAFSSLRDKYLAAQYRAMGHHD